MIIRRLTLGTVLLPPIHGARLGLPSWFRSFGVVAVLLELIPIANIFFAFTNTVGAALWAADLEHSDTTAPKLKEQAEKVQ